MAKAKTAAQKAATKKAAHRAAQKEARKIVDERAGATPETKKPPEENVRGLTSDEELAALEAEQKTKTPVRSGRVEARRSRQDISYNLGPTDQIVYRHIHEVRIGIRLGPDKNQRFHCEFNNHTFVITQLLAETWSENLPQDAPPITPEDIVFQLEKTPSFGREFILVAAPGFVPSEKVQMFSDKCLMSAQEKQIRMIQGARTRAR